MKYLLYLTLPALFVAYILYPVTPPPSPLSSLVSTPTPPRHEPYIILGFAPYWLMSKATPASLAGITDYAYFALLLDDSGRLYTHINRREQEPGYTNYLRLLQSKPARPLTLTFVPESQTALANILTSPSARRVAISTISNALDESGATGVNIDFEPLGNTSESLRNNFTLFIEALQQSLCPQTTNNCHQITVSIYPSAASRPRLWDLPKLAFLVNYFVVMTYDYTLPSEGKAGPTAPLRGAGELFEHDIITNLSELMEQVQPSKLLLGIPFYGYEWEVTSSNKYPPTPHRGVVASLSRIDELKKSQELEIIWDRNTFSPYAIRREQGKIVSQIYFENPLSIKLKLDLVQNAHLGGIAIWALGYEGDNPELWHTLNALQIPE